jgi:cytochrome P450
MNPMLPGTLLLDPTVIDNPYPFYRDLHRQAPVWQVPGTAVFVVSSYALLTEAGTRVGDFSSNMRYLLYRGENGLPSRLPFNTGIQTLANADPPLHTLHKNTVFPNFVAKRMLLLEPEIQKIATARVECALDKRGFDFMADIGNLVPITVVSRLIGFRNSDIGALLQAAFDSTEIVGATLSLERLQEIVSRSTEIQEWLHDQLTLATKEPGEDILTSIGNGIKTGVLSAHEGIIMMQTLLGAGGESTTSLLGNAVRILAEDRDLQERLRQHPELIPNFVEEALRLESPFRSMLRSTPKDTTLGGIDIPADATVMLFWSAGNRDPEVFDNPDEVILNRARPQLAFGRGIHFCIGAPLARLEAKVVLSILLARTSNIRLDPDRPPQWVKSLQVRRHDHLHVEINPR